MYSYDLESQTWTQEGSLTDNLAFMGGASAVYSQFIFVFGGAYTGNIHWYDVSTQQTGNKPLLRGDYAIWI